ncbi:GntR family transcriptional regulator [Peribacillus saganii]|uniref:GntR family transcriptional regulator n=1 Tax=Peribacillus saganii TaxID=2303992 RepID=A0A372LE65_9BACI|nr:GntR family transcriptional regulator [Peribacillus saganii]RFU64544.1 GntR family transcriptional regulator [Peribacillus saganii]
MKQSTEFSTLQEQVTATIREAIFKQVFKPGERLIQDELASKLGVSRMPIREALRCLEREGLVEFLPHKGAQVIGITKEDIEELYYLRSLLEGVTVQKSMYFLTETERTQLEKIVEKMDMDIADRNVDSYVKHNQDFHILLQHGCSWKKVKMLTSQFTEGYPVYVPSMLPKTMTISNMEHKAMLKALDEKDPIKLRQIVEHHIIRTGNLLAQLFE